MSKINPTDEQLKVISFICENLQIEIPCFDDSDEARDFISNNIKKSKEARANKQKEILKLIEKHFGNLIINYINEYVLGAATPQCVEIQLDLAIEKQELVKIKEYLENERK